MRDYLPISGQCNESIAISEDRGPLSPGQQSGLLAFNLGSTPPSSRPS